MAPESQVVQAVFGSHPVSITTMTQGKINAVRVYVMFMDGEVNYVVSPYEGVWWGLKILIASAFAGLGITFGKTAPPSKL